jgi:Trypsin
MIPHVFTQNLYFSVKSFKVTLGIQRLSGKSDSRVVIYTKKKVLHKGFDPEMLDNDIALLKLPKKVKLGLNNPLLWNHKNF